MTKNETPTSGFADTFISKLKEQSFTILIMVGVIWYQGKMMEERVAYWQKLYEEKETYIQQSTKEDKSILIERIKYLQEQRDKYVEELINNNKNNY
jgi:exosome complex RNA-binding protein Rrp4